MSTQVPSLESQLQAAPEAELPTEIMTSSTEDIVNRTRLLENELKLLKSELARLKHEETTMQDKIKDNRDKIKLNKQLPYLVGNVVELLEMGKEQEQSGAHVDLDAEREGTSAVIKTSTRQV